MSIAEVSIKNRTVTLVMCVLLVVGGVLSFGNLARLEDPEFTIKDAQVITSYPGATPEEVELEVTEVIETEIQKLGQLKELESLSMPGLSIVTVTIQDKYDKSTLPSVWEQLRRKIHDVSGKLPPGVADPVVYDDFGDVFGLLLAVTGDGFSVKEIQDYADELKKELLLVKDVAKIDIWGAQTEAIYVEFSRARMSQLGISQDMVYAQLNKRNQVLPSGSVRSGRDYIRIQTTGSLSAVSDIENLLLRPASADNAKPVYLADIARVSREYVEPASKIMTYNGRTSVALGISTASGGNVVKMGHAIQAKLDELIADTPVGLEVREVYMQPKMVTKSIDGFVVSLGQAVAIVIVVLLVFMGLRSGLLIGAILLITVLATFPLMLIDGVALERISLGALVIALGMLVDNAIVVTEGMLIRIQSGQDRIEAARQVVRQTMWPLFGATLIAIMAFAGIGLSQDSTGEFTRSLFKVILFSLGMSWIIAITITPLFCVMFLKGPKPGEEPPDPDAAYSGRVFQLYRSFLKGCIHYKSVTLAVMVLMLGSAIYGFGYVEQSFFPKSTLAKFMVHYWLPEGSDIRKTQADIDQFTDTLLNDERVESVSTFAGAGAPRFLLTYSPEKSNSSYGLLLVAVKDYKQLDGMIDEYMGMLRDRFPDADPKIEKFKLGPGGGSSIEVRFAGPDISVLRQLASQAKAVLRADGGATSIRDNFRQRVKVLTPEYSESRANFAGVTRADLSDTLNTNFTGSVVGVYRENDDLIPIISRAPEVERLDMGEVKNLLVWSSLYQRTVPIEQVINGIELKWRDNQIWRRDRTRTVTVGAEPLIGNASVVFKRVKGQIEAISLPPGYSMAFGGEYENSKNAQEPLAAKMPLVFGAMILITIVLFNSLRHPLIIWLTIPLALIGVTAGLLGTGQSFGFMPLLGFLSLSGMLIKNAIVLLDEINLQIEEGKPPMDAVLDSAVSRARPVCMAAGTTVLGMIPLFADDFFIGMAVTIMAGLAFASVLTLIVVPVLYVILFRVGFEPVEAEAVNP